VESVQEAYDWTIMAFKIAEDPAVQLPVAINLDGFTLTHCMMDLQVLKDKDSLLRISMMRDQPILKCGKNYAVLDGEAIAYIYEEK
jgi:pyruvate/2-oxoacid:ferredoxin oxidoreductase alpha subunit